MGENNHLTKLDCDLLIELQSFLNTNKEQTILTPQELRSYWHSFRGNFPNNLANFKLSINSCKRLRDKCLSQTRPQPGDPFGLQLCTTYSAPRQQDHLNVKRCKLNNQDNNGDYFFNYIRSSNDEKEIYKYLQISKNEMIKSFVNYSITHTVFRLINITNDDNTNKIINMLKPYISGCKIYESSPNEGTYLGIFFCEKDTTLVYSVFYKKVAPFSKIQLIFTSNRLLFSKDDEHLDLFVANSITFLYCFITDRYKPIIETTAEEFMHSQCCIVTLINALTKASLKHSGIAKTDLGPLILMTHESGIMYASKEAKTGLKKIFPVTGIMPNIALNRPILFGTLSDMFEIIPNN
jgi:hypothetical protein